MPSNQGAAAAGVPNALPFNNKILDTLKNDPSKISQFLKDPNATKNDYVVQASGFNSTPQIDTLDDKIKGTGSYPLPISEKSYKDLGFNSNQIFHVPVNGNGPLSGGPNANADRVFNTATQAVNNMVKNHQNGKLLLVGHSMGGMEIERAVNLYGNRKMANGKTFKENIRGILAEQTPFSGAGLATQMVNAGQSKSYGMKELTFPNRSNYYNNSTDIFGNHIANDPKTALNGLNVNTIAADITPQGPNHTDGVVSDNTTIPLSGGNVHSYYYPTSTPATNMSLANIYNNLNNPGGHYGFNHVPNGGDPNPNAPPNLQNEAAIVQSIIDLYNR